MLCRFLKRVEGDGALRLRDDEGRDQTQGVVSAEVHSNP